jgi:hypothetical protein
MLYQEINSKLPSQTNKPTITESYRLTHQQMQILFAKCVAIHEGVD